MRVKIGIAALLLLGACAQPPPSDNLIVPPDFGDGGSSGGAAASVTAFRVGGEPDPSAADRLREWPVLEKKGPLAADLGGKVQGVLDRDATYGDMGAKCFIPGMGFRLEKDGKATDVVICLECSWAYFYEGEGKGHQSKALSKQGLTDLAALHAEIFGAPAQPKD